ncbi:sensor histidine kinase [Citricoccus sp. GCM10030269]|uniref:sensor histidine kinase n=1 Tax=Citricoccus sp. GCM10030269 TaxID=3273388 RepID=UPI00360C4993
MATRPTGGSVAGSVERTSPDHRSPDHHSLDHHSAAATTGAPYGAGEWPLVPLKRHERFPVLVTAGVWLVFLVWPLVTMITGDAPVNLKILGFMGMAVFVTVYLGHFIWPWPLQSLPHWANTLAVTLLLGLCVLAMAPAAGLNAYNCLPFTLAIWIFPHRIKIGLPVAVGLAIVWVIATFFIDAGTEQLWIILPTALALVIMVSLRLAMEREENARVLGEEVALYRQREQFGRDVHDVLGHSLTVITLKTELARRLMDSDSEADATRAKAELDEVLSLARESLTEVRNTVGGLHSPDLGGQLAAARTALDAAGIEPRLPSVSVAAGWPAARRELFAWCLREAVTNVVRHSQARRCTVTLNPDRLTVSDDGVGPCAPQESGHGLRGMHQRVSEAGGTLSVGEAKPGEDRPGTLLEVRL